MEKAEKLILTAGPSITEKEIAYVNDAVSKLTLLMVMGVSL